MQQPYCTITCRRRSSLQSSLHRKRLRHPTARTLMPQSARLRQHCATCSVRSHLVQAGSRRAHVKKVVAHDDLPDAYELRYNNVCGKPQSRLFFGVCRGKGHLPRMSPPAPERQSKP